MTHGQTTSGIPSGQPTRFTYLSCNVRRYDAEQELLLLFLLALQFYPRLDARSGARKHDPVGLVCHELVIPAGRAGRQQQYCLGNYLRTRDNRRAFLSRHEKSQVAYFCLSNALPGEEEGPGTVVHTGTSPERGFVRTWVDGLKKKGTAFVSKPYALKVIG